MMVSTVRGRFRDVSAKYEGDPADLAKGKVTVEIGIGSVETFDEQRDGHLKSDDFFNAEKYPVMKFVSKKILKKGESDFEVIGDLTIRDITREVRIEAEYSGQIKDPYGNDRFGFTASGQITREEFGLKWNTVLDSGGVMVGSKVKFNVDGELIRQKED